MDKRDFALAMMGRQAYQKPEVKALAVEEDTLLADSGVTGSVDGGDAAHPGGMGWDNCKAHDVFDGESED